MSQLAAAVQLSQKVADTLEDMPDEVLLIARAGQDLSVFGLTYSHAGFLVRTGDSWHVWHSVKACDKAEASVYEEGLPNFFIDAPYRYATTLWRLAPSAQVALRKALQTAEPPAKPYSLVANPTRNQYANSNTWVARQFAKAFAPAPWHDDNLPQWLQETKYEPSVIQTDVPLWLAALVSPFIRADDQTETAYGVVTTATVDSNVSWISRQGWCLDKTCKDSAITIEEPAPHSDE